jgi:hypothetical protein
MPPAKYGRDTPRGPSPRRSDASSQSRAASRVACCHAVAFDHDPWRRSAITSRALFASWLEARVLHPCFDTMTNACQSPSTLDEMLREAAGRLARSVTLRARDLTERIDELQRSLRKEGKVSAQAEQEIVSIYVLSQLESSRRS